MYNLNFKVLAIVFVTLISFASCNKKEDTNPTPAPKVDTTQTSNIEEISLAKVFGMQAGTITAEQKITGIVISKKADKNFPSDEIALQNGELGIVIKFKSDHKFEAGDKVEVLIQNAVLQVGDFRTIQVADNDKVTKIGVGTVEPRLVNYHQFEDIENRVVLVKFEKVTMTPNKGTVYNDGSNDVAIIEGDVLHKVPEDPSKDHHHQFDIVVLKEASFAAQTVPTDEVFVTGINYGFKVYPRDIDDIVK